LPDDDALVERLLDGTASPEDIAGLTPGQLAAVEAYRAALEGHHGLADVWKRIEALEAHNQPSRAPLRLVRAFAERETHVVRSRWRRWHIAASILVTAMAVAGITHQWMRSHTSTSPRFVTIVAPRGQRIITHLPDGTRLIVAAASQLTYDASQFGTRDRVVTLVGQASFSVFRHDDRPFTVRAGPLVTRDVGTTFSIRAYPRAPTRVAVAEGSVTVSPSDTIVSHTHGSASRTQRPVLLTAGMAAMTPAGRRAASDTLITSAVDSAADFGWATGALVFHGTPLRDVVAAISRNSDVDMSVSDDALAALEVYVSFHAETPDQACTMLAVLAHAKCHRNGRQIVLGVR
jgi:transmembrane sensor